MAKDLGLHNGIQLFLDDDGPYFNFVMIEGGPTVEVRFPKRSRLAVGRENDPVKRAIGFKKTSPLCILDLTAGLLRDTFHFADLGCQVTALEENPLLSLAIKHELNLGKSDSLKNNIEFISSSAEEYLDRNDIKIPDVIFYDPMYVHFGQGKSSRSASSGKESVLLQKLCAPPNVEREIKILLKAKDLAKKHSKKVVVKRALKANPIGDIKPNHSQMGRSTRYDIYLG